MVVRSIVLDDTENLWAILSLHTYLLITRAYLLFSLSLPIFLLHALNSIDFTCVLIELQKPMPTWVFVFTSATPIYRPPKLPEANPAQIDVRCSVDANRASATTLDFDDRMRFFGNNGVYTPSPSDHGSSLAFSDLVAFRCYATTHSLELSLHGIRPAVLSLDHGGGFE